MLLQERLLERVELAVLLEPFDGRTPAPSAWTANIVHDFTGGRRGGRCRRRSCVVSQPMWVPVSPRSSRMKWTSSRRGSTSASCCLAVDRDADLVGAHRSGPLAQAYATARSCAARRARRVISRTIDRLYSAGPWASETGRLCPDAASAARAKVSSVGSAPTRHGLCIGRGERALGDRGEADAGVRNRAVLEPQPDRGPDGCEVTGAALQLPVRPALPPRSPTEPGSRSAARSARSRWRTSR